MKHQPMAFAVSVVMLVGFVDNGKAEETPEAPTETEKPAAATPTQPESAKPKKASGDAADPTDVTSAVNVNFEWQRNEHGHGRTLRYGLRLSPKLGVSKAIMIMLEMPFMYADNSGTKDDAEGQGKADDLFGVGDVRARFFYLPYKKPKLGIMAFGASVDMFAPSGKAEHYLGTASWVVAPGFVWGFALAKWFQLFPILSYNAVIPDEPNTGRDVVHSLTLQAFAVFRLPLKMFAQVIPLYSQQLAPDRKAAFNTEFIFGWQPSAHGVQIKYMREFVSDEGTIDQVRLAYSFFY